VITNIKNLAGEYEESTIQQDLFTKFPKCAFNIYSTTEIIDLLSRIEKNTVKLSDICSVNRGIEIGKSSSFVTIEKPQEDFRKVVSGEDVRKYKLSGHKFIVYRPSEIDYKDESVYTQEKIIARDIRSRFAAYDNEHHYTLKTAYNIILKDKSYNLKYILAIYNSKLMTFYHRKRFAKEDITLPRTYIFEIEQLPIKPSPPKQQKPLIKLVDKMLSLTKKLSKVNTDFDHYVNLHPRTEDAYLKHYVDKLPANDVEVLKDHLGRSMNRVEGKFKEFEILEEGEWLVFKVGYLLKTKKGEMPIRNVRASRCRIADEKLRKFLYYSIKEYTTPGKLGKGNIYERLLKIKIPQFVPNAERNKRIIDEIMVLFLEEVAKRDKLEKEIEETDRTIDQMVYDLYGLTDEEIRIIEEAHT